MNRIRGLGINVHKSSIIGATLVEWSLYYDIHGDPMDFAFINYSSAADDNPGSSVQIVRNIIITRFVQNQNIYEVGALPLALSFA